MVQADDLLLKCAGFDSHYLILDEYRDIEPNVTRLTLKRLQRLVVGR